MFLLRKIRTKFMLIIVMLWSVFGKVKTEDYPKNSRTRTYFQSFQDIGVLNLQFKNSEYTKWISKVDKVLLENPLLGLDVMGERSSGFEFNKHTRTSSAVENYNSEVVPEVVKSHTIRKRQIDDNNFPETVTDSSTLGQQDGFDGSATSLFQTTNNINFISISEEQPSPTDKLSTSVLDLPSVTATSMYSPATSQPKVQTQCERDVTRIFTGVSQGDQWALEFLDSWGKPGSGILKGQLRLVGDYQECRNSRSPSTNRTGFKGNYCAVGLVSGADASQTFLKLLLSTSSPELGACLPDTCSAEDIFTLFSQGMEAANLSSVLSVGSVDCRTDDREYTAATICSIIFLSIIGALMVIGTALDIIIIQLPKWMTKRKKTKQANENGYHPIDYEEINRDASILHDEEKTVLANGHGNYSVLANEKKLDPPSLQSENRPLLKRKNSSNRRNACIGILRKVCLSFSIYTNGQKMLNTAQSPGSLSVIHGIRFFSMSWVILGHLFIFAPGMFKNVATTMPAILQRWTFDAISNALVSVDTFFTLSGLLTAYVTTKEIQRKGWKLNWALYYFHRFWRLTPAYMLVLLTTLGLQKFMGSGALWSSMQPMDKTYCEERWWTNLLYINNFFNTMQMCMGHSWYLASDMQFYILSPLMIIPFHFNKYAGMGSCLFFLLVSWITTGVLSTTNSWPATLLSGLVIQDGQLDYQHYYYYASYCRIGPFVIGILTGYLLAITKGKIHMRWFVVLLGWAAAIAVALACVYGIHGDITGENVSSVGVSAFYNVMARTAWGACISWVIVASVAGYGGPVNAFLSWSPFVFLGRLTYMSYLIHPTVIRVYFENMDQLFYLNDTNLVISFLGLMFFTSMASFVLVLGFESPMIGLEKVLLGHQKK